MGLRPPLWGQDPFCGAETPPPGSPFYGARTLFYGAGTPTEHLPMRLRPPIWGQDPFLWGCDPQYGARTPFYGAETPNMGPEPLSMGLRPPRIPFLWGWTPTEPLSMGLRPPLWGQDPFLWG